MQPQSCDVAIAALAAQRQQKFWNFHDKIFESNLAGDEKTLADIAKTIGVDILKWNNDRNSSEVYKQLSDDIQLANKLGINATPTVFINGRKVNNSQERVVDFLIQLELDGRPH